MKRSKSRSKSDCGQGWSVVRECTACGRSEDRCRCEESTPSGSAAPVVRLQLQKRRGKPVTVVETDGISPPELQALAKELKVLCGSGGTTKGDAVELQGEHRERLRTALGERGMRVKG